MEQEHSSKKLPYAESIGLFIAHSCKNILKLAYNENTICAEYALLNAGINFSPGKIGAKPAHKYFFAL
ncbi:hypothetical protein SDC9_194566 [bioreactor metagenome]|uniref:Uncharacterized protein n=1 Tax=bioreactor metagenome TaxID=1076179 RepID=A0A645I6K8_9ZZZZ